MGTEIPMMPVFLALVHERQRNRGHGFQGDVLAAGCPRRQLRHGDINVASAARLPISFLISGRNAPLDDAQSIAGPFVQKLALAEAFNDAWALVAAITAVSALSLLVILLVEKQEAALSVADASPE